MAVVNDDDTIGVYNIIAVKGATFRRTIEWLDNNGNPIDLTNATAEMKVRKIHPKTLTNPYSTETEVLTLKSADGDITFGTPPTNGMIYIVASATDMDIEPGNYYYDLEITISSDVDKILRGNFDIVWEATF